MSRLSYYEEVKVYVNRDTCIDIREIWQLMMLNYNDTANIRQRKQNLVRGWSLRYESERDKDVGQQLNGNSVNGGRWTSCCD